MDQDKAWHEGRPRTWPHCVRWGPSSPPQTDTAPQLSARTCCGQMTEWIKMPLGIEVGLGPGNLVLDGDPAPPPQIGGTTPRIFSPSYCGQTAGWIKMALGTDVGLGPDHIVLDRDPAPPLKTGGTDPSFRPMFIVVNLGSGDVLGGVPAAPLKGAQPPVFGPCLLWPNGWMDEDATWYGRRPRPRPHCVRRGHSPPRERGTAAPSLFGSCLLWPRSPISATGSLLLSYCSYSHIGADFCICVPGRTWRGGAGEEAIAPRQPTRGSAWGTW